jgi:hypothetical protein
MEEVADIKYMFIIKYNFLSVIAGVADHSGRAVFAHLNAGIVGWNPTRGMIVCMHLFCVCVVCDGLIPRPTSPTDCVYDYETEKAAKVQQKDLEP